VREEFDSLARSGARTVSN